MRQERVSVKRWRENVYEYLSRRTALCSIRRTPGKMCDIKSGNLSRKLLPSEDLLPRNDVGLWRVRLYRCGMEVKGANDDISTRLSVGMNRLKDPFGLEPFSCSSVQALLDCQMIVAVTLTSTCNERSSLVPSFVHPH